MFLHGICIYIQDVYICFVDAFQSLMTLHWKIMKQLLEPFEPFTMKSSMQFLVQSLVLCHYKDVKVISIKQYSDISFFTLNRSQCNFRLFDRGLSMDRYTFELSNSPRCLVTIRFQCNLKSIYWFPVIIKSPQCQANRQIST